MSNTNTGGSAFPYVCDADFDCGTGMTLRDYFAAKAMQADVTGGLHEDEFAWTAARSYKMADALLKAREA